MEKQDYNHIKETLKRMGRQTIINTNKTIFPFKPFNTIGEFILFIIQNTKKGTITISEIADFIDSSQKSVSKRLNIMFESKVTI